MAAPTPIELIVKAMCEAGASSVDYGFLEEKTKLSRRTIGQAINRARTRNTDYFMLHAPSVYSITAAGRKALCDGCVHRPKTPTKLCTQLTDGATGLRALVWKLARIKRSFDVNDCLVATSEFCKTQGIKNPSNQIRVYLCALARASVLIVSGKMRSHRYVLAADLGPKAPTANARGDVFDANKGQWILKGGKP
jgi:hypothetical protein